MTFINIIVINLFGVFIVLLFLAYIVLFSNTLYCMIFERDGYKRFNKLISLPDEDFYNDYFLNIKNKDVEYIDFNIKSFPEWCVTCNTHQRISYISEKTTNKIIACSFYQRGSRKLYNKLINIYNNSHSLTK